MAQVKVIALRTDQDSGQVIDKIEYHTLSDAIVYVSSENKSSQNVGYTPEWAVFVIDEEGNEWEII